MQILISILMSIIFIIIYIIIYILTSKPLTEEEEFEVMNAMVSYKIKNIFEDK